MKKAQLISVSVIVAMGLVFSSCESLKNMAKNHGTVKYEVKPSPMEMHGGKVKVSMDGTIPQKYFWVNAIEVFQPVVKYEGGEKLLKPVYLRGLKTQGQGMLISNKEGGNFTWQDEFDYEPGMEECVLTVNPVGYAEKKAKGMEIKDAKDAAGVKGNLAFGERNLAPGMMITSTRIDKEHSKVATVPDKYEKETVIPHTAWIYFQKERSELNLNLPFNKTPEAKGSLKALDSLFATGMVMKSVSIKGWASPEGEEDLNQTLSDNRGMKTAKKYFTDAYNKAVNAMAKKQKVKPAQIKQDIEPNVESMGEDWDQFMVKLSESDIKDKNTIVNVIKSEKAKSREAGQKQIREMIYIYQEIEDAILPPLRRAEIRVEFLEPKKTDEEIAQLSLSAPDSLKLEELLYAATLTEDKDAQLQIYLSATEVYPEDYRGFNNAAALYIEKLQFDEAQGLLETALGLQPGDGAVLNNMGAVAVSRNDFENARSNFEDAMATGNSEAAFNMGMLKIKDGDYAGAVSAMSSEKCVYNLALAQLLNGQAEEAKATLNCMEPVTADANYLLAVCAARNNQKAEMIEALKKAVEEKPALKQQAQKDVEFLLFREDAQFREVIR